ncbi:hypothetical protein ACLKA7_004388 [Drosophila subpalustris]
MEEASGGSYACQDECHIIAPKMVSKRQQRSRQQMQTANRIPFPSSLPFRTQLQLHLRPELQPRVVILVNYELCIANSNINRSNGSNSVARLSSSCPCHASFVRHSV